MPKSVAVQAVMAELEQTLAGRRPELYRTFAQCFPNTLETTLRAGPGGTTFAITGDIEAMWLRDSSAQVWPYVPLCAHDAGLRALIAGLIRQQARCLNLDPYANAFNATPRGPGHADEPPAHPLVWERKFELDSLCYPVRLAHAYWRATGDAGPLDADFHAAARRIVATMRVEQRHAEASPYAFWRPNVVLATDNLPNHGRGHPVGPTGMVWSAFRPSDDACTYNYNVPGNMMAVVELGHLAELADAALHDPELAREARALRGEIERGIQAHAVAEHPNYGPIYAYETDGLGHQLLMDDANVPSLLSIPYLGYRLATDEVYQNTRRFVLSEDNPYFYRGKHAAGVGSPHTPGRRVWPIALAIQGLTSTDPAERAALLETLLDTTAGTGYMHESFDPDQPSTYTRAWFAWANTLFGEFVMTHLDLHPHPSTELSS